MTAYSLGLNSQTIIMVMGGFLLISILMNMTFISFFKKFPTMKVIQQAYKKGQQIAFIHDPEGSVTAVPLEILPGSNQLDFGKNADKLGVKFTPRGMNEAEFIDRKLAVFHYVGQYPHNLPVTGISTLSRVKRVLEARRVKNTPEVYNAVMHRNLENVDITKPETIQAIRDNMVPGNEERIPDDEMVKLSKVQKELKKTINDQTGPFIFADSVTFLHSVGMSASVSLREWKSYVIQVARGEIAGKSVIQLDGKTVAMIAIGLAIAYVISQSGSLGSVATSIKV
jgi:hypothetical protein